MATPNYGYEKRQKELAKKKKKEEKLRSKADRKVGEGPGDDQPEGHNPDESANSESNNTAQP